MECQWFGSTKTGNKNIFDEHEIDVMLISEAATLHRLKKNYTTQNIWMALHCGGNKMGRGVLV